MPIVESLFSETIIFPKEQKDQNRIPLWLKFFCYEYTDNSLFRTAASLGVGPMLKCIMLPAPKEFVTKTDNIYDTGLARDTKDVTTTADPQSSQSLLGAPIAAAAAGIAAVTETFTNIATWVPEQFDLGMKIDMDMSDSKFRGTNKRVYNFKMILAARSAEDSELASQICDTFEAFSLPSARIALFSKFASHPPLWKFGIGPGGNAQIDRSWSGQPQLCVLDQITVSKTGFQDNYGIADKNGSIKPIAQTINMTFVELEPALRTSFYGSNDILNRSTSFYTFGGSLTSLPGAIGSIIR